MKAIVILTLQVDFSDPFWLDFAILWSVEQQMEKALGEWL